MLWRLRQRLPAEASRVLRQVAEEKSRIASDEVRVETDQVPAGQEPSGTLAVSGPRFRVLYFLNPDCPHCKRVQPAIEAFASRHPGIQVIGLSAGSEEKLAAYRNALGESGVPVSIQLQADQLPLFREFAIKTTPSAVFLDTRTRNAVAAIGFSDLQVLEAHLARLLSLSKGHSQSNRPKESR